MTIKPKVSIVVPTFNQEEFVETAIKSALDQTYDNLEVIVSDDASTDRTEQLCAKFLSDERFQYHRNATNVGRVANYRKCLYELASGDWVLNLDGDDYLLCADYISTAMNHQNLHSGVVLVFARTETVIANPTERDANRITVEPSVLNGNDVFTNYLADGTAIPHLSAIYRGKEARAIDFYRFEGLSSDWESLLRLVVGRKVVYYDQIVAGWRRQTSNATALSGARARFRNLGFVSSVAQDVVGVLGRSTVQKWERRMMKSLVLRYSRQFFLKSRTWAFLAFVVMCLLGYPRATLSAAVTRWGQMLPLKHQHEGDTSGLEEP